MSQKQISCHECHSDFENWNYGKRGRPPKRCEGCRASAIPRAAPTRPRARRRRKPSEEEEEGGELRAVIDLRQCMLELGVDNDEKQATRDKLTAHARSHREFFYSKLKQANPLGFSLAGVLHPDRPPGWKSQWDNPRSTENRLTAEDPNLKWLCANKDDKTFYSIPPEHRYGDQPQDIVKIFGTPNEGNAFDYIILDLTCGLEPAMGHIERILRNDWLWEKGFLAIWFDHGNRLKRRNKQFLEEHNSTGCREYLETLLRRYYYETLAEQGVAFETYKQRNSRPKADDMVLLMVSAARSASKSAYKIA